MKYGPADTPVMTHYVNIPDVVFGPIAMIAGVLALGIAWHYSANVRAMVRTARSDVGTVPGSGLVEVSGRVHDVPEPLTAPVSGADCLSYTLTIEEYRQDDDVTKEWTTVDRVERATPFVLTDDTGTVTIDPADPDTLRCDIATPERETREVSEGDPPDLAGDIGVTGDDAYPRRYRETHLPAADELYVLGEATSNGDRIENSGGQPFVLSTDGERHTVVRHTAYSLLASGIGVALFAFGGYVLLGELGLL